MKKSIGKRMEKKADKAGKKAEKAIRTGSESLKMNLVRGAAALRREVEERTPAMKKAVESGVGKVMHMTGEAAKLARLKVEIVALRNEKGKLLEQLGGEVWHLHQQKRLDTAGRELADVFGRLEELNGRIAEKEKAIGDLSIA